MLELGTSAGAGAGMRGSLHVHVSCYMLHMVALHMVAGCTWLHCTWLQADEPMS